MTERVFVEQETDDTYRIAVIDANRIYQSTNPGTLATVFECSLSNPTDNDRAEIFFALAPYIGADYIFADVKEKHRSCKLNNWDIGVKDKTSDNIFAALSPMTKENRVELYSKKYSITPEQTISSTSKSLFSLVDLSKQQSWKTGILQRCIDSLVQLRYRGDSKVYSLMDMEYRRVMRFKYETEFVGLPSIIDGVLVAFIRKITMLLGLKHSRDETVFTLISPEVDNYVTFLGKKYPMFNSTGELKDKVSHVLNKWVNSTIVEVDGGYKLKLNDDVTEALSYTTSLLSKPNKLAIIETPM